MLDDLEQASAQDIRRFLLTYLTAWEDGRELGDPDFDRCVNVSEFATFLGRAISPWSTDIFLRPRS